MPFFSERKIVWCLIRWYADVCLLFSIFNGQWIPELRHYAPGVPIVLVGTKLSCFEVVIRLCLEYFLGKPPISVSLPSLMDGNFLHYVVQPSVWKRKK